MSKPDELTALTRAELMKDCKRLYVSGLSMAEITQIHPVSKTSLQRWSSANGWTKLKNKKRLLDSASLNLHDPELIMAKRINALTAREHKTEADYVELSYLCERYTKLKGIPAEPAQPEKVIEAAPEPQEIAQIAEPKPRKQRGEAKEKKIKNDIASITEDMLMKVLKEHFFSYQMQWWEAKNNPETRRNRFILKSRQIGATYYFAFEALADAIISGDNQIFLSASRDQAEVFKAYIIAFALEYFEVELKGAGFITLSNGAELRFLSTNSRTAQSYHGHLYIDECFWIPDFEKMWKVASGMAAHKRWRRTLFSTPSATSHQAFKMWSGEKYNEGRKDDAKVNFEAGHKALKQGALGIDKIWRHMVTVKDAEQHGCDLFDIEELKTEYSADDFNNLFMCKFIDDAKSVFNLQIMMTCYATADYTDYKPGAARPFGSRPVALGYDPSRTRDNASLAILAIPLKPGEKWRVLKCHDFNGQNFQYQASRIKEIVESHNVQHIGIDITGIGYGLFELVEQFYRRVTPINYSNEVKTQLVMKAIDVIENGRFEYEAGNKQITQAFMMITKTTTGSGGAITYSSNRNNTSGHADIAWSIMHALYYEPIVARRKSTAIFSH